MGKKLPHTPRSRIKAALRQLSLRSRERAATMKRDNNSCVKCGVKQSKAKGREVKVVVHHKHGIKWDKIIDFIYAELLVPPEYQEVQCKKCHDDYHKYNGNKQNI